MKKMKMKWYAIALLGFLAFGFPCRVSSAGNLVDGLKGLTSSPKKESDEKLAAKVEALMTLFNQQETEADALPYLQKARDLIEKMHEPRMGMITVNMVQTFCIEPFVLKGGNVYSPLDWTERQLEKISPEKVSLADVTSAVVATAHVMDRIQYLEKGASRAASFMEKLAAFIGKAVDCQKDSADYPLFEEKLANFQWMAAWNAVLGVDYKKADEYLSAVEKQYQKLQKSLAQSIPKAESNKGLREKMAVVLNDPNTSEVLRKEILATLEELEKDTSVPESTNAFFAHVDFLRAFILCETDKKDEALNLFRQGIQNDLKHSQGIYSKNLYSQLQAFEIQGHDISGLQTIREELESRLKNVLSKGIEVTTVGKGSVAEKVGIQKGDRLVKHNGWYITGTDDFSKQRWAESVQKMTKTATMTVLSNGETRELEVPVGRLGIGIKDVN